MKSFKFTITSGVENWEVLQQHRGKADACFAGVFEEDPEDDTQQILPFSQNQGCARILREEDGVPVTGFVPVSCTDGMHWEVCMKDLSCGGPYMLDLLMFDPKNRVEYPMRGERRRHFCVGDNYLIAGQSNAAGMGKGVLAEKAEVGIHVLRHLKTWDLATQPFDDLDYSKCSMFMAFAKKIKHETGYPVGLIPAAMGAAGISRFLPEENGDLYEKMAKATFRKGIKIRGVLWYQGCTDAGLGESEERYLDRFARLVSHLREDFQNSDLQIFTFQLNRQMLKEKNESLDDRYDVIREAQRKAPGRIEGVSVLPAIDATIMTDFIHASKAANAMLGERLALQVLDKVYHIGLGAEAPDIAEAVWEENRVEIGFSNVTGFLYTFDAGCHKLPLVAEDGLGKIGIVDYTVKENTIFLELERCCTGAVFLSGQCGTNPGNLIIDYASQIPMLCFRRFTVKEKGVNK